MSPALRVEARFISEMATFYDESPKCVLNRFLYDPYGLSFYLDHPVDYIYKNLLANIVCSHTV